MAAHSVAAAHATISARAGPAPGAEGSAPGERLSLRRLSSSVAGRGQLRSPLPARRRATSSAAVSRRQRVVRAAAAETVEGNKAATGELLEKSVNTIRFLAIDVVEKANSGHPCLPMGCAPVGHVLYDNVMRYNPKNPYWFNRDRFVLSAGHDCMLRYALLHLAGYDNVKMERFAPITGFAEAGFAIMEEDAANMLPSRLGVNLPSPGRGDCVQTKPFNQTRIYSSQALQ